MSALYRVRVTAPRLNLRAKPSASAKVLEIVEQGTELEADSGPVEGWVHLAGGAYVREEYLEPVVQDTLDFDDEIEDEDEDEDEDEQDS